MCPEVFTSKAKVSLSVLSRPRHQGFASTKTQARVQVTMCCLGYQTTLSSPGQRKRFRVEKLFQPIGSLRFCGEATACTRQKRLMCISNGGLRVFKERNKVSGSVITQAIRGVWLETKVQEREQRKAEMVGSKQTIKDVQCHY